jgi:hypothetical protein
MRHLLRFCSHWQWPWVAVLAVATAGCGAAPNVSGSGQGPADSVEIRPPRYSVCGIDRTGSYDFVGPGLELCARLVAEARPGDVIVFRWISHASYLADDFIARFSLPDVALVNCTNPFDQRCKRARGAQEAQLNAVKRAFSQQILHLRPTIVYRTDIYGFFQAASEILAAAPAGAERHIYAATDLLDNVRYRISPDLQGMQITIFAFQTDANPQRTLELRRRWETFFRNHGAAAVAFHTAEVWQ